ncbi:hypothetical protein [Carnimonas nigrificans]|uniref:hypothetical protein n=1 Tax=Carnimonas nigrificans TaxID=64323 RepID=UPI00046F3FFF|nr:hypothetical protein [Carnimonas nigrificans]
MKMKLSDHFKYKNFSEELLPFLNNFLSTSVLMAISLSVVIMHVNKIVTFFMIFFMIMVILAMFINNKKFVSCIIDNPVPESVSPFYNAKGPKPLGWYMEFLKTLLKEKNICLWEW